MKLHHLIKPEYIKIKSTFNTLEDLFNEMLKPLNTDEIITNIKPVLKKLIAREKLGSTSIGNNAAVPHAKIKNLKTPFISIYVLKKGMKFSEHDLEPIYFVILILSPENSPVNHLNTLAAAAAIIKKTATLKKKITLFNTPDEIIKMIKTFEQDNE